MKIAFGRRLLRGLLLGGALTLGMLLAGCNVLIAAFSYQGRLLNSSGSPVPDGNYTFDFGLWDAISVGTEVCSDTGNTIAVTDGLFNAAVEGCDVEVYRSPLWLEVTVNGETLSPRQALRGAPYANSVTGGAVVQAFEPIDRTLDAQPDTGAGLAVFNSDSTNKGGHGLLVANNADMDGTDGYFAGDSAAIAARALGDGYAAVFESVDYRGMYVDGDSDAGSGAGIWFDAFFAGDVGISVNGSCSGCKIAYIAQNDGSLTIRSGDLVVPAGVRVDPDTGTPIMLVRAATSADDPVVGVAGRAMERSEVRNKNGWMAGGFDGSSGNIRSGGYLMVVVHGIVQARASQVSAAGIGEFAGVASDGGVGLGSSEHRLGRVLSAPDSDGLVWILFGSQ